MMNMLRNARTYREFRRMLFAWTLLVAFVQITVAERVGHSAIPALICSDGECAEQDWNEEAGEALTFIGCEARVWKSADVHHQAPDQEGFENNIIVRSVPVWLECHTLLE